MKKFNRISSDTVRGMTHVKDMMEIDNLNTFFDANFGEYYVRLENNKYVCVIGVRKGITFRVM